MGGRGSEGTARVWPPRLATESGRQGGQRADSESAAWPSRPQVGGAAAVGFTGQAARVQGTRRREEAREAGRHPEDYDCAAYSHAY